MVTFLAPTTSAWSVKMRQVVPSQEVAHVMYEVEKPISRQTEQRDIDTSS